MSSIYNSEGPHSRTHVYLSVSRYYSNKAHDSTQSLSETYGVSSYKLQFSTHWKSGLMNILSGQFYKHVLLIKY